MATRRPSPPPEPSSYDISTAPLPPSDPERVPDPPPAPVEPPPPDHNLASEDSEPVLRRGDRGPKVRDLQLGLKALGLYAMALDGIFGQGTENAIRQFESEHGLHPDGIADAYMLGRLDQELLSIPDDRPSHEKVTDEHLFCSKETLEAWEKRLVPIMTNTPVMYAPGRGYGEEGTLFVSHKDGLGGDLGRGKRQGQKTYGFVCSTFVNFALAFLTNRSSKFTPKGGMPPLMELCERTGLVRWRDIPFLAYGEHCTRLFPGRIDVLPTELHNLDTSRPRFLAVAQSTCDARGRITKALHHVAIWWVSSDGIWRRIAADGSKGSFTPMNVERMDYTGLKAHNQSTRLLVYALHSLPSSHPNVKHAP